MTSNIKQVYCPIMGKEIDYSGTCMDICFVAEEEWPESELPEGVDWTKEKQDICMTCKEHPDLD